MIEITFMIDDEYETTTIANAKMHIPPRIGEAIWLLPHDKHEKTAFRVTDVAHWVSTTIVDGYHHCAVYLKEIERAATDGGAAQDSRGNDS
jgi:hypothetical protein